MLRGLVLLLAVAALLVAPPALGQNRNPDLSDLWTEYPLDPNQVEPRPAGSRERDGSIWGSPPADPQPAGPVVVALFYVALAVGVLGIGGAIHAIPSLRFAGGSRRANLAGHDDGSVRESGEELDDGPTPSPP